MQGTPPLELGLVSLLKHQTRPKEEDLLKRLLGTCKASSRPGTDPLRGRIHSFEGILKSTSKVTAISSARRLRAYFYRGINVTRAAKKEMTNLRGGGEQVEPDNTIRTRKTVTTLPKITKAGKICEESAKGSVWQKEASRKPNFHSGYSWNFT